MGNIFDRKGLVLNYWSKKDDGFVLYLHSWDKVWDSNYFGWTCRRLFMFLFSAHCLKIIIWLGISFGDWGLWDSNHGIILAIIPRYWRYKNRNISFWKPIRWLTPFPKGLEELWNIELRKEKFRNLLPQNKLRGKSKRILLKQKENQKL